MKLGIGIDTGGTYTDAVVYDFEQGRVVDAAKSLTTKSDLALGIGRALDALDPALTRQAALVSLSTTLATNACVEGKGGRAKLLFLGVGRETLDRVGQRYGVGRPEELFCFPAGGSFDGKILPAPDWDTLMQETADWLADAEGLGIVELHATKNGAVCEKQAKARFAARYALPIVCGYELFSGLDAVQRGAGTLLNAKLIPIIREFLAAIKQALRTREISAPIVIVRSDGSLMSEQFSMLRPVETILCGPAASVLGGKRLSNRQDSIIVDIGGTTTDVSLVKNGAPVTAENGIHIGGWRTFVRGVFIDTFGLGGDSAVRAENGRLHIDVRRVVPISLLAQRHPQIKDALRELLATERPHTQPVHEFYLRVRDIADRPGYTETEKRFCAALAAGPLPIRDAAAAIDTDIYRLDVSRLEAEGIVLRAGLTPTDIMHLKGDFAAYDPEGAELAARFVMRCLHMPQEALDAFCDEVYNAVKKKLYCNIVRILLMDKYPALRRNGLDGQMETLIAQTWDAFRRGDDGFFRIAPHTKATLVGIGAPTHIFLPDVARALQTECVIPEHAGVANAVGAIVAQVSVTAEVRVAPNHHPGGIDGYTVHAPGGNIRAETRDEAVAIAMREAEAEAREEAKRRGISGDTQLELAEHREAGTATTRSIDLGSTITATLIGGIKL